jgi:hypothetical protein
MNNKNDDLQQSIRDSIDGLVKIINIDSNPSIKNKLQESKEIASKSINNLFAPNNVQEQGIRDFLDIVKQFIICHDKYDDIQKISWLATNVLDFACKPYTTKLTTTVVKLGRVATDLDTIFWYCSTYDASIDQKRIQVIYRICNANDVLSYILMNSGAIEVGIQ